MVIRYGAMEPLGVVLLVLIALLVGGVVGSRYFDFTANHYGDAGPPDTPAEYPRWEENITTVAPIPESMAVTNAIHATGQAIEAAIRAATTPFTYTPMVDQPPASPHEIAKAMQDAGVSDLEWVVDQTDPFDHVAPDVEMTGAMGAWFHAPDDDAATNAAIMVDFDPAGAGDDYNP